MAPSLCLNLCVMDTRSTVVNDNGGDVVKRMKVGKDHHGHGSLGYGNFIDRQITSPGTCRYIWSRVLVQVDLVQCLHLLVQVGLVQCLHLLI